MFEATAGAMPSGTERFKSPEKKGQDKIQNEMKSARSAKYPNPQLPNPQTIPWSSAGEGVICGAGNPQEGMVI